MLKTVKAGQCQLKRNFNRRPVMISRPASPHFSQTVYRANFYWCGVEKFSSPRTIEQELRGETHFLDQYYEHMSISGAFSENKTHLSP